MFSFLLLCCIPVRLLESEYCRENMQMTSNLETEERDELAETYNSIYLNQHSFECGLLSAGCVLSVVDNVLQDSRAGLAIVRPPGHHAEEVFIILLDIFTSLLFKMRWYTFIFISIISLVQWDYKMVGFVNEGFLASISMITVLTGNFMNHKIPNIYLYCHCFVFVILCFCISICRCFMDIFCLAFL